MLNLFFVSSAHHPPPRLFSPFCLQSVLVQVQSLLILHFMQNSTNASCSIWAHSERLHILLLQLRYLAEWKLWINGINISGFQFVNGNFLQKQRRIWVHILHEIKRQTSVVLTGIQLLIKLYAEIRLSVIYVKIHLRCRYTILFNFKLWNITWQLY